MSDESKHNTKHGSNSSEQNLLTKSDYHSVVTFDGKDDEKDVFEFDKFVKADAKISEGFTVDSTSGGHDSSSIHFHTGYTIPATNTPQSVVINNTVVLNDRAFVERTSSKQLFTPVLVKQAILMTLWYITSFISIMQNKYLLSSLDLDPGVLGFSQIVTTTIFGCGMMYLPFGKCHSKSQDKDKPPNKTYNRYTFIKTMTVLGFLRFGSMICSIIGLKYVAVSFAETIKSSAPLFTAITAYFILGEYSGLYVNLSLIPIMSGLAISTSSEISFNMTGFLAAISNNVLDCIQNVFSKKLLSSEDRRFSPLELQFYTSVAATFIQLPFWFTLMDMGAKIKSIERYTFWMLVFNGMVFYAQSLFAYSLMSLISPITFSVSNTVKRAGLIWFSVLVFGNAVTVVGAFGTFLVIFGVFLYQKARQMEAADRERLANTETVDE